MADPKSDRELVLERVRSSLAGREAKREGLPLPPILRAVWLDAFDSDVFAERMALTGAKVIAVHDASGLPGAVRAVLYDLGARTLAVSDLPLARDAVAAERHAAGVQRGFDAGQAAKDGGGVLVAEVTDAKTGAGQRAQGTGEGDLEALARHGADGLDVGAGGHAHGGDGVGAGLGPLREETDAAVALGPAFDRSAHRTGQAAVALEHGCFKLFFRC